MRTRALLSLALFGALAAACGAGPTASHPATQASSGSPGEPTPTGVPGGDQRTVAPEPGTFETAWGAARDGLPAGFPLPPGTTPAEPPDPAEGPVSGAFVVGGAAGGVAELVKSGLEAAGYSTAALSGPLEDGSLVIDSVGADPGCRVQTRVRPLGGTTMITILYGAACPWR